MRTRSLSILQHTHRALLCLGLVLATSVRAEDKPAGGTSFRQDIMPVLFRAGCNAGACHGAARGKDGFMLSLFGYDPAGDYFRIVDDMAGRRINPAVPEQSLLLLKSTGAVPHTGGKLFDDKSEYYATLRRWIAAGAPDDAVDVPDTVGLELSKKHIVFDGGAGKDSLLVTALLSDGSKRDVTSLARYHSNNSAVAQIDEHGHITAGRSGDTTVFARYSRFALGTSVIVLPSADGFAWPNPPAVNYIDTHVFERLKNLRIAPSDLCDDETFLRRVTLDLAARPPTVAEYRAFMADPRSDKRTLKIDELIASDTFADYWTSLWAEQLRVMGGNYAPSGTPVKAADAFYEWMRRQLRADRPLNEFVREMVTASGSNLNNGPVNLYTMLVHSPQFTPKAFAADFSQVFLGVQLQCAECHNHPFDRWDMDDYYGFVSFFTGISRKSGVESREQRIFFNTAAPPAMHLRDERPMPAKVLGAIEPVAAGGDPRRALAAWLTAPENDMFSRNLANRIWAQFMGRGIIHPVDDVRVTNPPANEPLLQALAQRLVQSNFSLRSLARDICTSRTYQLTSQSNPSNARDRQQFSHAALRRLRADVLIDTVVAVTGMPRKLGNFPDDTRAIDFYPRVEVNTEGPKYGDNFFKTFGASSRATVNSTEIKCAPTLSQTLHMAVGDTINHRLSAGGALQTLVAAKATPDEVIEELFLLALSRRPTAQEAQELRTLIGTETKNHQAYESTFWALLNSTEFIFNH